MNLLQCFQVFITLFALLSAVRGKYQSSGIMLCWSWLNSSSSLKSYDKWKPLTHKPKLSRFSLNETDVTFLKCQASFFFLFFKSLIFPPEQKLGVYSCATFVYMVGKFLNLTAPELKRAYYIYIYIFKINFCRNWITLFCSGFYLIHNYSFKNKYTVVQQSVEFIWPNNLLTLNLQSNRFCRLPM